MATVDESFITVQQLLKTPFADRELEDQIRIITGGKPRPSLKMFNETVKDQQKIISQDFDVIYDDIQWLTGCPIQNKLFCWPCLLYGKPGLWNSKGIPQIIYAIQNKSIHENKSDHMNSVIKLELFIREQKTTKADVLLNDKLNEDKEIKKRLIDVCCIAIKQHEKSWNSSNLLDKHKCIKIMELIQNYDKHKNLTDKAMNLLTKSPMIIKVVYALTKAVTTTIFNEIKSCKHVSLILNQHGEKKSKPLISTILRYVQKGWVFERFLGFTSMDCKLTAESVHQHILDISKCYDLSGKICAISLDGSILQIDELYDFLERMQVTFPSCVFVPWYALDIDSILQQSLCSCNSACGKFFKVMSNMYNYFQDNSGVFSDFMQTNNSPLAIIYSNASLFQSLVYNKYAPSQFIIKVRVYHAFFIGFFDSIINKCKSFNASLLADAIGFRTYLIELQTIFMLEFFCNIFNSTSNLKADIKNDIYNLGDSTIYPMKMSVTFKKQMFKSLWQKVKLAIVNQPNLATAYDEKIKNYISLFNTLSTLIFDDTRNRYEYIEKLNFCSMFNTNINKDLKNLKSYLSNLYTMQIEQFSEEQIYSELSILRKHEELADKSLNDMYQFLIESNLNYTFKAAISIMELILTMPVKPATTISNVSKIHEIEKWSNNFDDRFAGIDISLLCIEFEVFDCLTQCSSFYDEIFNIIGDSNID